MRLLISIRILCRSNDTHVAQALRNGLSRGPAAILSSDVQVFPLDTAALYRLSDEGFSSVD